ncbi:MAG: energy transducer TonB [Sideroxydans sp.]|nr:energy transducer TonB [Sideroxydans sp.]NOT98708.1 energy transducer TonB [Sideroxydans sp.]
MKRLLAKAWILKERLVIAAVLSIGFHAFAMFGITGALPDMRNLAKRLEPLEVTLVNSKSKSRPTNATAYAQNNLDGGGNVAEDIHASTPFPVLSDDNRFTPEQNTQRTKALEEQVKRLLTQTKSNYQVERKKEITHQLEQQLDGQDLVQLALEIARLEAEINKSITLYERMPKRKFIGARAQEYRYAQYVEDWRSKVERIGNLNYPEALRREKIFGKVRLTINIHSNGTIEKVEIDQTSGNRKLDAAAVRIAKLAAPYAPFPPDIRKEIDILSITRTWTFTTNEQTEVE